MVFDSSHHSLVVVGGKISAIEPFCKLILAKLEDKGYSEEDVFAIHLALEEAFVNAVNHGNKKDPTKEVKIEYVNEKNQEPDDLTQITGIGPKISDILQDAGITNYAQLAGADKDEIRQILSKVGLRLGDPESWIQQAQALTHGD